MAMLLAETSKEIHVAVRYVHCVAIGKGRAVARILSSTVLHTSLFRHIYNINIINIATNIAVRTL